MSSTTEAGLYIYAIVPDSVDGTPLGTGIDDVELELLSVPGGVAAVVHRHTAGPYQGADADVERWILQHSQVIERLWDETGTVLPMSFNVIVAPGEDATADEQLQQWLGETARGLSENLTALAGRVELRVEISLDQQAVAVDAPEVAQLRQDMEQRPAGVKRLLQKRLDTMEREVAERFAEQLYPDYRRRLAALSEDVAENRRSHRPAGYVSVLTIALLVAQQDVQRIGAELTAIQEEQPAADIRFLGPWPPYSFAEGPEPAEV